jgi:hypothetical protein
LELGELEQRQLEFGELELRQLELGELEQRLLGAVNTTTKLSKHLHRRLPKFQAREAPTTSEVHDPQDFPTDDWRTLFMEWQPNDTVRVTPPPVRKPGKPHTRPLREILQAWVSPNSKHSEGVPVESEAQSPDPAEPLHTEETCIS